MVKRLENKTIIITGSARGIGKSCAVQCAVNGANVVVHGRTLTDTLKKTKSEIEGFGGKVIAVYGDVSRQADCNKIVQETIEAFGTIDGLVNNAGVAPFVDFMELSEETWDSTMGINAKGTFLMTQSVARVMIEKNQSGSICNITSISGVKATNPMQVAYCSSKGAANMFTKTAAVALGKYNITVNAILPGTIETDINREILEKDNISKSIIDATPLACLGQTNDIAHAVVYFMSNESRWVSGSLMVIDGGFIA